MNFKKMAVALVIAAGVAAGAASCVAQRQYRTDGASICEATATNACATSQMLVEHRQSGATGTPRNVYLGFVEFDDQGDLWSRAATGALIERVRALAAAGPVSIVVFAHGWNHNASGTDTDALNFQHLLGSLYDAEAAFASAGDQTPKRTIVGIFLGWRGRTAPGALNYFTFWDRKNTAHTVGSDGAFEVLDRLSGVRNSGKPGDNRLVLIGHSFGGALMYAATAHALSAALEDMSEHKPQRFADLVVILNAAVEAQRFGSLLNRSRELEAALRDQMPLFLSITSSGDVATKYAFPAGRYFSTLFQTYRSAADSAGNSTPGFDQAEADRTTIGHFRPFITHVLASCVADRAFDALASCPTGTIKTDDVSPLVYRDAFRATAEAWYTERQAPNWHIEFPTAVLYHTDGPSQGAVMNVLTNDSLVQGHTGIWGSPIMLFVRDLIALNFVADRYRRAGAP